MNKEKINKVGELLEVDYSEINETKRKWVRKKLIFPIVQISNFILSSISGTLFGFWENQKPSGYPYSGGLHRVFTLGILTFLGLNTGNIIISKKSYKHAGSKAIYSILIVFMNLIVSAAGFVLLYIAVENVPPLSGAVAYNTFKKPKCKMSGRI